MVRSRQGRRSDIRSGLDGFHQAQTLNRTRLGQRLMGSGMITDGIEFADEVLGFWDHIPFVIPYIPTNIYNRRASYSRSIHPSRRTGARSSLEGK